jgi:hypothetical protein
VMVTELGDEEVMIFRETIAVLMWECCAMYTGQMEESDCVLLSLVRSYGGW